MKNILKAPLLLSAALFVFTAVFWLTGLDISVQQFFYGGGCSWKYADMAPVKALYRYGTYPAMLVGLWFVMEFILSFVKKQFADKRRRAAFMILVFLVGPGLLVNVIFKSYGGRPRPRDLPQFCGMWEYRPPLMPGTPGKGHSFPCGHASVGFALGAFYFAFRRKKPVFAGSMLAVSVIYGSALGVTRMAQGGHFLSDVIWSAAFVYGAMYALAFWLKPDTDEELKIKRSTALIMIAGIFIFSVMAFLLSVPYYKQKETDIQGIKMPVNVTLKKGSVKIPAAITGKIRVSASGFGVPGLRYEENTRVNAGVLEVTSKVKGIATELNPVIELNNQMTSAYIATEDGDIEFDGTTSAGDFEFYASRGDIYFRPGEGSIIKNLIIDARRGNVYIVLPKQLKVSEEYKISINAGKKVDFTNNSAELYALKAEGAKASGSRYLEIKPTDGGTSVLRITAKKGAYFK